MTNPDPEKQETLLPPASAKSKERTHLETALVVLVPMLFISLITIVCFSVRYHAINS